MQITRKFSVKLISMPKLGVFSFISQPQTIFDDMYVACVHALKILSMHKNSTANSIHL